MNIFKFAILTILIGARLAAATPEKAVLFETFTGFTDEGLKPIYALFQGDTQGRMLLRKAWRKLDFKGQSQLKQVFCYCTSQQLAGHMDRRGQFSQESAVFYRAKGDSDWLTETLGALEKLNDPARFPIIARRSYATQGFEYMEVAFLPKVCLKRGMSVLQTYLVLVHELTHLVGLDPFEKPDLLKISRDHIERDFYFPELEKPGGELEAYLAQIEAFRKLKVRYGIAANLVLESFLTDKGLLLYRDKPEFLHHLLYQAKYQGALDTYLANEIVYRYNRAQSWWEYFDKLLAQYDGQLVQIDKNIAIATKAVNTWKQKGNQAQLAVYKKTLKHWELQRRTNRQNFRRYEAEQKAHIDFMLKIDKRFPE